MINIEFLEAHYTLAEHSNDLRFYLDEPRGGRQERASNVGVAGWILSRTVPVVAIEVQVNGRVVDQIPVNQPRPDVAADHSDFSDALQSGFAARVDLTGPEPDVRVDLAAVLATNQTVALATLVARLRTETAYFTNLTASGAGAVRSNGRAVATTLRKRPGSATSEPICSVVIPVHNHVALTQQCLDTLLIGHHNEPEFEIVVVDDASTDDTPELLASYGEQVRVVTLTANQGFAGACNAAAETARGKFLVFLNNDTVPTPGWLAALVRYADVHPAAGVIGSKLLYPDDTVQHAGIVFGSDGLHHHIYAGFPKDHPAVNISRRFQAVTAACCLVRRQSWDQLGGFDTSFINGWEDVDLCLRFGAAGQEIHYCHESVLYHLDKASRGQDPTGEQHNRELFQQRWGERVEWDSIRYYVDDGLFYVFDSPLYPLVVKGSPELVVMRENHDDAIERVLGQHAEQVATLRLLISTLQEQLAESTRSEVGSPVESSKI